MSLTLWGRLTSSNVQKVVWTLGELELPFEHIWVGAPRRAPIPPSIVP